MAGKLRSRNLDKTLAMVSHALETNPDASFDELAAQLRKLTVSRKQTPSEILQREGRDERSAHLEKLIDDGDS
jgi:hypothetical protein